MEIQCHLHIKDRNSVPKKIDTKKLSSISKKLLELFM